MPHLDPARELRVADHDSRHEDGQEAGAVGDRRNAVDDPGGEDDRERIQRAVGQREAAQQLQQEESRDHPDGEPDSHLAQELERDVGDADAIGVHRELDHPDHQRDPDRVVEPRFALQDRPGAALDLLAGEHREGHGGVGRSQRRADQESDRPVEAEQVVGGDGDERGGQRTCRRRRGS